MNIDNAQVRLEVLVLTMTSARMLSKIAIVQLRMSALANLSMRI